MASTFAATEGVTLTGHAATQNRALIAHPHTG